jgi:hypothetical protein
MLRPSKHAHPDQTAVGLAVLLLKRLQSQRLEAYDDLLSFASKSVVGGDVLFRPALSFLFLIGTIRYHPATDAVEYMQARETV